MKRTKLLATIFTALTLAVAGRAVAEGAGSTAHHFKAGSADRAGKGHRAGVSRGADRFAMRHGGRFGTAFNQFYPPYPYGYGYPPYVGVLDDGDTWIDQWRSIYEDNDGPSARAAREGTPEGSSRIWEICDQDGCKEKQ